MSGVLSGLSVKAFKSGVYFKFAATVNDQGDPNVVPLLSAQAVDSDTIAFVRFMTWKTRKNFEANAKISFGCRGPKGRSYLAECEFSEWVTKGPLLEKFDETPIYRYNAYAGANVAGVVKIKAAHEYPGFGFLGPMFSPLRTKVKRGETAGSNGGPMPVQTVSKWGRLLAIKFLGMIDGGGFPLALPHQGVFANDSKSLVFAMPNSTDHPLSKSRIGDKLAASVLVFDPSAYQVKGRFAGEIDYLGRPMGVMSVEEVYAAAPPLPGHRIYPPETYET